MRSNSKKEIRAYGVHVLLSGHPEIRRLKHLNTPSSHGNKFWASSWLLMDYFRRKGLREGSHVLEIGCGWGLAGIYCAKRHGALVKGVDIDPDVFPFLKVHAKKNNVDITTLNMGFDGLKMRDLAETDILIGADICFWDDLVDPMRRLIRRALRAGVGTVLIADPGRSPFEALGEYFMGRKVGEMMDWAVTRPRPIQGRILKVSGDGRK